MYPMTDLPIVAEPFVPPRFTTESFVVHSDCRHYDGAFPCKFWRPCQDCPHHDPVGYRVLIVLLEALGDVLLTSPLPKRLKLDRPDAHVTWLVYGWCAPLVRLNPYVDRVLEHSWQALERIRSEHYDLVLGLEREPSSAALVHSMRSPDKRGIALGGPDNGLYALTPAADGILMMDTWNDFRTRLNRRTWTELYFDVSGFRYQGEPYEVAVSEAAAAQVRHHLTALTQPAICLNVGASFEQKEWSPANWKSLALRLLEDGEAVVLLGGPKEGELVGWLLAQIEEVSAGRPWQVAAPELSLEEALALPAHCKAMVTGDSFGLHVALSANLPCVAMFGPSSPHEVVSPLARVASLTSTYSCSPCAHQMTCGGIGGCMSTITVEDVVQRLRHLIAGA